jgi:nucleotide-binding universal stress UspA family protein
MALSTVRRRADSAAIPAIGNESSNRNWQQTCTRPVATQRCQEPLARREGAMLSLKTILVPVDFSERSVHAAEHAVVLAKRFHSQIVLVHVIPPAPFEYAAFDGGAYTGTSMQREQEIRSTVEQRLCHLAAKIRGEQPVEARVLIGDPANEIERLTQEIGADLLVMPTHGYGPFRRFVLGSLTTKVLHDVSCPVFTGTHIPEVTPFNPEPYKRVACAIDLGPHSEAVLSWAWDFAQAHEEDLTIIHAAPPVEIGGAYGDLFPAETRQGLLKAAQEEIKALMEKVGCRGEVHVECANPATYVRDVSDKNYVDILVIGRSPDHGLLGRLRTHAYAIIREAPCPVISI